MLLTDLQKIDKLVAKELLEDTDTHALALVIAANALLDGDLLDDEDDIVEEEALRIMLDGLDVEYMEQNIIRIIGYLNALVSETYVERVRDFMRLTSAVIEGDLFFFEENPEEMSVTDATWSLYQLDLLFEDNLLEELSPKVLSFLRQLNDGEAVDMEELQAFSEGMDPEEKHHTLGEIDVLREELAEQLKRLRVPAEWIDSDELLATLVAG